MNRSSTQLLFSKVSIAQELPFSWVKRADSAASIQYEKTFGNTGICMLQVAKNLLHRPEQAIPTVFGSAFSATLATYA